MQKNLLEYMPALDWRCLRQQMQQLKLAAVRSATLHLKQLMRQYRVRPVPLNP